MQNNSQSFKELKEALHMLAHVLIAEGQAEGDHGKWFLGNALGTILIASEKKEDIQKLSGPLQEYCQGKRDEEEQLEKVIKNLGKMPIQKIPGISDLLNGTGVCLN